MKYVDVITKLLAMAPELAPTKASDGLPPRKFSLDAIRTLLTELGNPQQSFTSVLIAGTNGKGSTASTLAAIANAAGLRTGLYTSPHLLRINERIRLSADSAHLADISDDDFAAAYVQVDAAINTLVTSGALPHYASYFEVLTAMAFVTFAAQNVQLAIVEVGLGGRLDATNVVDPIISIITDIGMDHMDYLGNTLTAIATEKAGILRDNGILITLSQHPEANAAIGEAAISRNVRGVDASRFLPGNFTSPLLSESRHSERSEESPYSAGTITTAISPVPRNHYTLSLDNHPLEVDSPLPGQHQQRNIALAIAAAVELRTNHSFPIPNAAIESGIRNTYWPGRLEWLSRPNQAPILLDVAHNPAGAWTLRAAISQLPENTPRTLIFSCLADKQIDEMAQVLLPLFDPTSGDPARIHDHIILAPVQSPRAATVAQLQTAAHKLDIPTHASPHVPAALAQAEAITPPHGIIVATGSIFLIGELRALIFNEALA